MRQRILFFFFIIATCFLSAQDSTPMRVIHCTAVGQDLSVSNIYIDEKNTKIIAAGDGLYQLYSADISKKQTLEENDWYLLLQNDGNFPMHVSKEGIEKSLTPEPADPEQEVQPAKVNVAFYNEKKKELWIGTAGDGIYQLAGTRATRVINHYTTENSKLKSNHINAILLDRYNRLWIGTDSGVFMNQDDDWKLYEKRDKILAVTALGPDVWILGEGVLWMVQQNNRWIPGDVDSRTYVGAVRDIQYDSEGRLWVASEVITRYDVENDKVEVFGNAEGFTSKDVSCIKVDGEDALWVGTYDKGLFLIEKESVMSVSVEVEKGVSCEGGKQDAALKLKIFGGTPPYRYRWSNGFDGVHAKDLGPGEYSITVNDANGQKRITKAIIEGQKLFAKVSAQRKESGVNTNDGIAFVQVSGGTPDYAIRWGNGAEGASVNNLGKGTHRVTITDRVGCVTTAQVEIDRVPPPEPEKVSPLVVDIQQDGKIKCAGSRDVALNVNVEGGKPPYSYIWNSTSLSGPNPKQLGAGNYSLTVTDALGSQQSTSVSIADASGINLKVREDELASTEESRDGKATVAVSGGAGGYVILWDNGETQAKARKLTFGNHTVSVSDSNGCEAVASIRIGKKIIPQLNTTTLRTGQTIQMEQLFFDADSTRVKPSSEPALTELFEFLNNNKTVIVEIGGHTNDIPPDEFCNTLSTARAKSVADYIIQKGIEPNRIVYKGYGKRKPLLSNRTAEGRRKNQRVEIKILKLKG